MKRLALKVLKLAVLLLVLALFFPLVIGPEMLIAPITLLFGWWSSMVRLSKAWHSRPDGIAMFVLAVVALVAGSHAFLRWLYASLRNQSDSRWPVVWRWKWTVSGYAMLGCTLLAICSLILTTHQIYWTSKSSDPLFIDPFREKLMMLGVATSLRAEAEESQWDIVKTRDSFLQGEFTTSGQPAAEAIQPVWIEKDGHSLRAIILIPRRPLHRATANVTVLQPGTKFSTYNLDELPQVLASFGVGTKSPLP